MACVGDCNTLMKFLASCLHLRASQLKLGSHVIFGESGAGDAILVRFLENWENEVSLALEIILVTQAFNKPSYVEP